MKESDVSRAVSSYFNIVKQQGFGRFVRTNAGGGMLLSYFDYQRLMKALNDGGSRGECIAIAKRASSMQNAEEGWPDWTGVIKRKDSGVGQLVGVEVKNETYKMSDKQVAMKATIESLGGIHILARSMFDAAGTISEITGQTFNAHLLDHKNDTYDYSQIPF